MYMGFCPLLEPVVGGADVFGEASSGDDRWGTLLQSGTLQGRALVQVGKTVLEPTSKIREKG